MLNIRFNSQAKQAFVTAKVKHKSLMPMPVTPCVLSAASSAKSRDGKYGQIRRNLVHDWPRPLFENASSSECFHLLKVWYSSNTTEW